MVMKYIAVREWPTKPFGIYAMIFGLLGVLFLFVFTLWRATPLIAGLCMVLALMTGVVGLVKGGYDNDNGTVTLSVIGLSLSIIPGLIALLALW